MIFKTTVIRSNPQIIRVFEMAPDSKLSDLVKTVNIAHACKIDKNWSVYFNNVEQNRNRRLSDCFANRKETDLWTLKYNEKINIGMFSTNTKTVSWDMRLELLEDGPCMDVDHVPRLLRFRGYHLDLEYSNVTNWNRVCMELKRNNETYSYEKRSYISASDYEPDQELINMKLLRQVKDGLRELNIVWDKTKPLRNFLEECKADDLKRLIREKKLGLNYNRKKVDLISDLCSYFNRDEFWGKILEEMTLWEYECLMDDITEAELDIRGYYTSLEEYKLIRYGSYFDTGYFPAEFVSYVEKRMMSSDNAELLNHKKAREIIEAAVTLYGISTKECALEIGKIMYPEVDLEGLLDEEWKVYSNRKLITLSDGKEVMYDAYSMTPGNVKDCWNILAKSKMPYYLPSKEDAIDIARAGLGYSEEADKEIRPQVENIIGRNAYFFSPDTIMYALYQLCHSNYGFEVIPKMLKNTFHTTSNMKKYDSLVRTLKKHNGEVRQVLLKGYTEAEVKAIRNGKV